MAEQGSPPKPKGEDELIARVVRRLRAIGVPALVFEPDSYLRRCCYTDAMFAALLRPFDDTPDEGALEKLVLLGFTHRCYETIRGIQPEEFYAFLKFLTTEPGVAALSQMTRQRGGAMRNDAKADEAARRALSAVRKRQADESADEVAAVTSMFPGVPDMDVVRKHLTCVDRMGMRMGWRHCLDQISALMKGKIEHFDAVHDEPEAKRLRCLLADVIIWALGEDVLQAEAEVVNAARQEAVLSEGRPQPQ